MVKQEFQSMTSSAIEGVDNGDRNWDNSMGIPGS
jgi:hypothetical protein